MAQSKTLFLCEPHPKAGASKRYKVTRAHMTVSLAHIIKSTQAYRFFIVVSVLFLYAFYFFSPNYAYAERVELFEADIVVAQDSSFTVTEKITYMFSEEKHGIFRCIPTTHQDAPTSLLKERYIVIDEVIATMDEKTVPYEVIESREQVCVKIGDPENTLSGEHTYVIAYRVAGAITYEDFGGAELYWNVTGHGWEVPLHAVEARVTGENSILLRERACYRGAVGKTASCEVREVRGSPSFSGRQLNPNEGLTIAQALDRSKIAYDVRERYKMFWIWGILIFLSSTGLSIQLYRYKTKFRTENPIVAQYEPYPDVKPMYAGLLFDKRLDPRDLTAGIVYLAKEGFIKIKKIDKKVLFFFEVDDYEMTLMRDVGELTDPFEKHLLSILFKSGAVGTNVTLSELKSDHAVARENALRITELESELKDDLKDRGFFSGFNFSVFFNRTLIISTIIVGGMLMFFSHWTFIVITLLIVVTLFILGEGRRTAKGYEALDHLKGFKDFLRVTETQRFIFHNAPEKNAEQFMEYLPYAIAFGVEKEWAKTFESITIPNPNWYDGGGNATTFNALTLTESLKGFSSSFAQASTASASSGGGSSGGGSGGGGGGSW